MHRVTRFIAAVLVASLAMSSVARSGGFTIAYGCDTLTVDPPRYRTHLGLYIAHYFGGPLCQVTLTPRPFAGLPAPRILDCEAPGGATCEIDDGAGAVTFTLETCVEFFQVLPETLRTVVDQPPPVQFVAGWVDTIGSTLQQDVTTFLCGFDITPARQRTWGRLKTIYR